MSEMRRGHWSDCAVNNAPALPVGPCDCGGIDATDDAPKSVVMRDEVPGTLGDFLRALASGTETEGEDRNGLRAEHDGPAPKGGAQ